MNNVTRTISTLGLLLLSAVSLATTDEEPRQSLTSEGQGITRGSVGDGKVTFNEFAPLQTEGKRDGKNLRPKQQKTGVTTVLAQRPRDTVSCASDPLPPRGGGAAIAVNGRFAGRLGRGGGPRVVGSRSRPR